MNLSGTTIFPTNAWECRSAYSLPSASSIWDHAGPCCKACKSGQGEDEGKGRFASNNIMIITEFGVSIVENMMHWPNTRSFQSFFPGLLLIELDVGRCAFHSWTFQQVGFFGFGAGVLWFGVCSDWRVLTNTTM